jgi:transposase
MSQETIAMCGKERDRLVIMRRVESGEMALKEAAWQMGVSLRQAVRIKQRFLKNGAEGLVHQARGMPSHRKKSAAFKNEVLSVYRERYRDFGPTLAAEKMRECEKITVGRETLRQWLMAEGLWVCGAKERIHRSKRKRREMFGEMLQIDGSDHAWFEERGPKSTLMVLIDDATGKVALYMAPEETTLAALLVLQKWLKKHGVPVSLYADRRMVYFTEAFVHEPERRDDPAVFTAFMRSAHRLNITMIPAYSPEAKGRVERMNSTLQDRLVKEFRLRNINTIEAANAMLDDFADELNNRFSRPPARPTDAHRLPPQTNQEWERCLCIEELRVVQRDNTVSYQGARWQIEKQANAPHPGARVAFRRLLTGETYWVWKEDKLQVKLLGSARR